MGGRRRLATPAAGRRGWLAIAALAVVGLSALAVAGRTLAPSLREPPASSTTSRPRGTVRIVPLGDLPPPPEPTWSTAPAASPGEPVELSGGGVRLRLPAGWHGRTASEGGRLVILQAANFPLPARDRAPDPIRDMTREQVVVTVTVGGPAAPVPGPLAIGASDFLHDARVPVGQALARKVVRRRGRTLDIDALFGARPPAPSLLRQVNRLLTSLTVD